MHVGGSSAAALLRTPLRTWLRFAAEGPFKAVLLVPGPAKEGSLMCGTGLIYGYGRKGVLRVRLRASIDRSCTASVGDTYSDIRILAAPRGASIVGGDEARSAPSLCAPLLLGSVSTDAKYHRWRRTGLKALATLEEDERRRCSGRGACGTAVRGRSG